jgi:maltooligosyltrehalose trehalohydrolase
VAHVIATGESEGYYADFVEDRWFKLARSLAEGFAYQGEVSPHGGRPRGSTSTHLEPTAFIDFLQNHDQVGNRAFGERLRDIAEKDVVTALMAILLLSPHIPLLFMGEEFGETRPFCFFTDFHGELADLVREGRRKEFAGFSAFRGAHSELERIPDPNAESTFEASRLDWDRVESEDGKSWLEFTQRLLALRRRRIVPLLSQAGGNAGRILAHREGMIAVDWSFGDYLLELRANLSDRPQRTPPATGEPLLVHSPSALPGAGSDLPPHSVLFALKASVGEAG